MKDNISISKKIIFSLFIITLLLFIVGCSPAEVSEEQIKNDVTSSAPEWDTDAAIDSFTIVRRTPNEEEKTEKVHVKIDGKTDLLYSLRYYTLSYFYSKDEGWMLSDIEAENEDLWETKPLAGPDTSLAKRALTDKYLYVNDDKWDITEETIKEIKIDKNDAILENMQASMNCTVILENDFVTVTGTASVEYRFDPECVINTEKESITKDGWYVVTSSLSDDYVCQFKSDKAPTFTTDDMMDFLDAKRFLFNDSYYDSQYIWLKKENISGLTVEPPIPTQKGTTGVFNGKFTYKTPLASFSVNYTINKSYDAEDDAWWYYADGFEFESECTSVNLPKNWSGTYNDGDMGVDLTLTSIKANGDLEAIYSFYPMPGNTSGKSGSYKMTGSYNPKTLEIDLKGSEWIERPSWYTYVNINGIIKADNSSIVSSSSNFHVFTDTVVQRMEKTPTVCDELGYLTDTQIQELKTAIDTIYSKYGVGAIVLLTSTEDTTWDYLCDYVAKSYSQHKYDEHGAICLNVGSDDEDDDLSAGWWGHKLDDFEPFENSSLGTWYYTGQYAKMIQEYILDLNRFLGGTDSELTFSW